MTQYWSLSARRAQRSTPKFNRLAESTTTFDSNLAKQTKTRPKEKRYAFSFLKNSLIRLQKNRQRLVSDRLNMQQGCIKRIKQRLKWRENQIKPINNRYKPINSQLKIISYQFKNMDNKLNLLRVNLRQLFFQKKLTQARLNLLENCIFRSQRMRPDFQHNRSRSAN